MVEKQRMNFSRARAERFYGRSHKVKSLNLMRRKGKKRSCFVKAQHFFFRLAFLLVAAKKSQSWCRFVQVQRRQFYPVIT